MADVIDAVAVAMQAYRNQTETMLDDIMSGKPDVNNHTIFDWIKGGSFVNASRIPSISMFEKFFLGSLVAKTINGLWTQHEKIYVLRYATDKPDQSGGPAESRWYDPTEKAVYHLYVYRETGHLQGYQDAPYGLQNLSTDYQIPPTDITKSSALAWQMNISDLNQSEAFKIVTSALSNPNASDPFLQGPGWVGTWTIPVCDTGTQNWNTQYGDKKQGMGFLPCCCGKIFSPIFSVNLILNVCRYQLSRHEAIYRTRKLEVFPNSSPFLQGSTW